MLNIICCLFLHLRVFIVVALFLMSNTFGISQTHTTQYIACPDAVVSMKAKQVPDATYDWYDSDTGGAIVIGGGNTRTLVVVKGSVGDIGIWWVETKVGATVYPRYKVELQQSQYCGNLSSTGCAAAGTVIYKEDFRGNNVNDPEVSPIDLIGGRSDLTFTSANPGSGNYALIKRKTDFWAWNGSDHTYPNDITRGYYMYIDPHNNQPGAMLYEYDILDLCDGISLSFTLWAMDLDRPSTGWVQPKIEMLILDKNTGDTIVTTGDFVLPRETQENMWRQYGFDFTLPSGIPDITFRLTNKESSGSGNDWALDDVEIHLCTPKVYSSVNNKQTYTTYCNTATIKASYSDSNTFLTNPTDYLEGYWMQSKTGNINNPKEWSEVPSSRTSIPVGAYAMSVQHTVSIDDNTVTYYRFVVSNGSKVDSPNCRAASEVVSVQKVEPNIAFPKDTIVCAGYPISLKVQSDMSTTSHKWYSDKACSDLLFTGKAYTTTFLPGQTTLYIEVSSGDCSFKDSLQVHVEPTPEVRVMNDQRICYGDEIKLIVLQSVGDVTWNVNQTTVRPTSTQQYIATASMPPCPDVHDTVTIVVGESLYIEPLSLPPYDHKRPYNQQLTTNAENPLFSAIGLFPEFTMTSNGRISMVPNSANQKANFFTVSLTDDYGCEVKKDYALVYKPFVPSVFSPNGDGINDHFMKGFRVVIYDRLGVKIYDGADGWDGTTNGVPMPSDTYFYLINYYNDIEEVKLMGYVYLLK